MYSTAINVFRYCITLLCRYYYVDMYSTAIAVLQSVWMSWVCEMMLQYCVLRYVYAATQTVCPHMYKRNYVRTYFGKTIDKPLKDTLAFLID